MIRFAPAMAAGILCAALGGCALAGHTDPPTTYDLVPARAFAGAAHPKHIQLIVNEPEALRALDTDQIMVRPTPNQISYFKGAAWGDRLPSLLRARLIESFQNSGVVKSVSSSADHVQGDYSLETDIRDFQIDIDNGTSAADVDIFAKLVNNRTDEVVASRAFSARVPASSDSAKAGVAAMNQAFTEILQDAERWVASRRL